jgi:hypothetical protein
MGLTTKLTHSRDEYDATKCQRPPAYRRARLLRGAPGSALAAQQHGNQSDRTSDMRQRRMHEAGVSVLRGRRCRVAIMQRLRSWKCHTHKTQAELFINMEYFPAKQIIVDKLGMNS